jgi:hypothetical protein
MIERCRTNHERPTNKGKEPMKTGTEKACRSIRGWLVVVAAALSVPVVGCKGTAGSAPDAAPAALLPSTFVGTYKFAESRGDGYIPGINQRQIEITPLGMVPSGSGIVVPDASLTFTKVSCPTGDTCTFEADSGCKGSITKKPSGDVVITAASFTCVGCGGTWYGDGGFQKLMADVDADYQKRKVAYDAQQKDAGSSKSSAKSSSRANAGGGGGDCNSKCAAAQNACVMRCSGKNEHDTQVCVGECAAKGQECMGNCS